MDTVEATRPDPVAIFPDPEVQPTVPLWPTVGQALGIGRSATYASAERGEIPVIRLGGRLVCPTAAIRRMLQLDPTPVA